jgi:hypothetical protein
MRTQALPADSRRSTGKKCNFNPMLLVQNQVGGDIESLYG